MYSLQQIAQATHGALNGDPQAMVAHILIDSRSVYLQHNTLFVAIRGKRHDGHQFVEDLYKRGVLNFIVDFDFKPDFQLFARASFVQVQDSLRALQDLAAWHRQNFTIPVVGITGSNGKTIVKEWLFQILRHQHKPVRSPKSYNSQVGVPLSVWQMRQEHDFAIFEAGISQKHEMPNLQRIIQPEIGIFTNIGDAHQENFSSIEEKIQEKLKLFVQSKALIYSKDHHQIHTAITQNPAFAEKELITWSRTGQADLIVLHISKEEHVTEIVALFRQKELQIKIPFTDQASIENALHVWALLLHQGLGNDFISKHISRLEAVAMRLELRAGINNCSLINDFYNADLGSLSIALNFLIQQKQHKKRSIILSDILQTGASETQLYTQIAQLINQSPIKRLIGIGHAISRHAHLFDCQKHFYASTHDFLRNFRKPHFRDETILLKASRRFRFERIAAVLEQKTHRTVLEINLNALSHNLNFFRSRLLPKTKVMVMVKAFSYGSGSFEIANLLQHQRVDYLGVAYTDEGIELRKSGITLPIMVMNPEAAHFDALIEYQLEPEIYSFESLRRFASACQHCNRSYPVHLKLDTGMHRLGFEPKDLPQLIVELQNAGNLRVKSIFSHLAAAGESHHDEFTQQQIAVFEQMSTQISQRLGYRPLQHILNSAGIERFAQAQFDMVRLGIGLYGISATEPERLEHISCLKTHITQIKEIEPGETVGYSRKGKIEHKARIATIAIGYADGFSRQLGNGRGRVLINGKFAPIVGNVCMDMSMVDVSQIDCQPGDEVIVFGKQLPVSQLAHTLGTIPYEIMTSISRRVKKVYFQE